MLPKYIVGTYRSLTEQSKVELIFYCDFRKCNDRNKSQLLIGQFQKNDTVPYESKSSEFILCLHLDSNILPHRNMFKRFRSIGNEIKENLNVLGDLENCNVS